MTLASFYVAKVGFILQIAYDIGALWALIADAHEEVVDAEAHRANEFPCQCSSSLLLANARCSRWPRRARVRRRIDPPWAPLN